MVKSLCDFLIEHELDEEKNMQILKNMHDYYTCYTEDHKLSCSGFLFLHELVMMTYEYPILHTYIEKYISDSQYNQINVVDKKGNTALHIACKNILFDTSYGSNYNRTYNLSTLETIHILLKNNADPNIANDEGYTPFLSICSSPNGHYEPLFFLLLTYGANANVISYDFSNKCNALYLLCKCPYSTFTYNTISYLLEHNLIDVNIKTKCGSIPLDAACVYSMINKNDSIVSLLIQYNANPKNIRPFHNVTPVSEYLLHCKSINMNILTYLVNDGSYMNQEDSYSKIPIFYLLNRNNHHPIFSSLVNDKNFIPALRLLVVSIDSNSDHKIFTLHDYALTIFISESTSLHPKRRYEIISILLAPMVKYDFLYSTYWFSFMNKTIMKNSS